MNSFLSTERINYILDHLQQNVDISLLKDRFVYLKNASEVHQYDNKIIFLLSDNDLDLDQINYYEDIPILFPVLNNEKSIFSFQGTNLIFHHDLIKSAFYLLSGYQELKPEYKGKFNRFPYELSVQNKLGITNKPIVNYYFKYIEKGISEYCVNNKIGINIKKSFKTFGFFLTHDIDKIDTYSIFDLVYYIKVVLGISKSNLKFKIKLKKFAEYLFNYFFTKRNPSWDFEFLRSIEEKYNFKSAFYFLPKDLKHQDAYYSFSEKRLQPVFEQLKNSGCEIGIHGTNRSATNIDFLNENIKELHKATKVNIKGIRQHRLIYDMNITPFLHQEAKLLYDTTLGFAEHEGFRNSYCHPFKLYNFKEEKAFKTWEIPLNIMDATLFEYRKLNVEKAFVASKTIIDEVIKFNGLFTLLWHNGYFDEIVYPGIKNFYVKLLEYIEKANAKPFLGCEINTL